MKRIIILSVILWLLCGLLAYKGHIAYEHGKTINHIMKWSGMDLLDGMVVISELEARQKMVSTAYTSIIGPFYLLWVAQDTGFFYYGQRWTIDTKSLNRILKREKAKLKAKNDKGSIVWMISSDWK